MYILSVYDANEGISDLKKSGEERYQLLVQIYTVLY